MASLFTTELSSTSNRRSLDTDWTHKSHFPITFRLQVADIIIYILYYIYYFTLAHDIGMFTVYFFAHRDYFGTFSQWNLEKTLLCGRKIIPIAQCQNRKTALGRSENTTTSEDELSCSERIGISCSKYNRVTRIC